MRDHRSLQAWVEAREVTHLALVACRDHWKPYGSAVFDQLQRSALSTQLNIAEGYALGTPRYFVNHLRIAYGSAVEAADLLQTGLEEGLLPEELAKGALVHVRRSQALLLGLIKRYRSK